MLPLEIYVLLYNTKTYLAVIVTKQGKPIGIISKVDLLKRL